MYSTLLFPYNFRLTPFEDGEPQTYSNIKDLHRSRYVDGGRYYFKSSCVHSASPRGFKHDLDSVVREVEIRERLNLEES